MRRLVAVVIIAATLTGIGACGGSSDDGPSNGATEPPAATEIVATPNPLATPPADWRQYTFEEYSVWLPPRFEGGTLGADADATFARITPYGGVCATYPDGLVERLGVAARFVAIDRERCPGGPLTNLAILRQPRSGLTIESFREQVTDRLSETTAIASSEVVQVGDHEAARIIADAAQYYIVQDDSIWQLLYATGAADLESLLPEFERIALTFEDSLPDE